MARIVMDLDGVDPDRVGATCGSQGGAPTIACAALEPRSNEQHRFPLSFDYKRVYDLDLCKEAYSEVGEWFRRRDPLHSREEETFTKLGYIDIQFPAPRIRGDVLMSVGLADTYARQPPSLLRTTRSPP